MKIDTATLTFVAGVLNDYRDDLEAFWDTLDGETDIMDQIGTVIKALNETKNAVTANDEMVKLYAKRKRLMEDRQVALTRALKTIMLAVGESKIPHPLATISLAEGRKSVVIDDETKLPTQLFKVTRTPDRSAIKAAIEGGEEIDGARIVTGDAIVNVRMK